MGAYMKNGKRCYITGSKISILFKSITKTIYPDIFDKDLGKFSVHMIRVTAAVLLQAVGKAKLFIQTHLRWESDAYKVYLQDTDILARQHNKSSALTNAFVGAYTILLANISPATKIPLQLTLDESGTYSYF